MRPAHAAWDNVTLPVTDSFWQTHYPPNGWRCRCRVVAVSKREYDTGKTPTGGPMNKTPPDVLTTEFKNRRTGEISRVPAGIDPGFNYNPGAARRRELDALVTAKTRQVTPALARAAQYEGLALESAAATYAERSRLHALVKAPVLPLAPISNAALTQAEVLGVTIKGKLLALDHDNVRHALSTHGSADEVHRGQTPISAADFAMFPTIFNAAKLRPGTPEKAHRCSTETRRWVIFGIQWW